MFDARTPDGKVTLYLRGTGEVFVRFPVDAREMMQTGAYALDLASAMDGGEGEALPSVAVADVPLGPVGVPLITGTAEPAEPLREPVRDAGRVRRNK